MAASARRAGVKLLLDEMISLRIAAELRGRGHDVEAIKRDRPELESTADRTIVTNNVKDYLPIHHQVIAAGEEHAGMIFTYDDTMPRNKTSTPLWVRSLEALLTGHVKPGALKNRVHHLPSPTA